MDLIMQQNRKILLVDDEARIVDELFKVLTYMGGGQSRDLS